LLGEGISKPREPARAHPYVQVHPFDVRRGNILSYRLSDDLALADAAAMAGAVFVFRRIRIGLSVQLDEHCVIHVPAEGIFHHLHISMVSIGSELDSICKASSQIVNEGI